MGARGPKPRSIEEKRLLGNPGKRYLPADPLHIEPMNAGNVRLSPTESVDLAIEAARPWLHDSNLTMVAMFRETLEERATLRRLVLADAFDKDLWAAMRAIDKQLYDQAKALCLGPAERGALGLVEVKARSKLEEFRDKRTGS